MESPPLSKAASNRALQPTPTPAKAWGGNASVGRSCPRAARRLQCGRWAAYYGYRTVERDLNRMLAQDKV
jgi:hypothetical protein